MRILKLLCVFFILFAIIAVVSCGNEGQTSGGADAPDKSGGDIPKNVPEGDSAEPEPEEFDYPEIPVSDFGGRTFTIINREGYHIWDYFLAEEQDGDPVNDALYMRKVVIEDRYNVKIAETIIIVL